MTPCRRTGEKGWKNDLQVQKPGGDGKVHRQRRSVHDEQIYDPDLKKTIAREILEALHVCELVPAALNGEKWMYIPSTAADCCEDADAVEAFDATFSPKERKWMPSQEEFYVYSHSSVTR